MISRIIFLRDPKTGLPIDRTRGESFDLNVTGGIFFPSAPSVATRISLDDGRTTLPVRGGRVYYMKASRVTLYHGPEVNGPLLLSGAELVTFDAGEDVSDVAPAIIAGSGTTADVTSGTRRVLCSFPYQNGAATRTLLFLYNPPGSGMNYTIRTLHTFQSASGAATDDDGFLVGKTVVTPGAAFEGTWGVAPKDAKALMYMDSARRTDDPALLARWGQQAGHALAWERRTILYPYMADMAHPLEGYILRPQYYICYETAPVASNGMLYATLDESDA